MSDPARLSILVTLPGGTTRRFAYDEHDVENHASGLGFQTSIPGGFKTATFNLPRLITREYRDEALFADVKIIGPAGQVAWEGRVQQLPKEHGTDRRLTVGCVGHAARLKDQPFTQLYIDNDQGRWYPPTAPRQAATAAALDIQNVSVNASGAGVALTAAGVMNKPFAEAWYDAGAGCTVKQIRVNTLALIGLTSADANLTIAVSNSTSDGTYSGEASSNLKASISIDHEFTTARRYCEIQFYYAATAAGTAGVTYGATFTDIAVIGDHGLPLHGADADAGFYASDIVSDIVARAGLTVTTDSIEPTTFPIPQAAFTEPTLPEDALLEVNKYDLKRWAVWENRTFWFYTADSTAQTIWQARLSAGAEVQLEGDSADGVFNQVVVYYTDPYGVSRIAGPSGWDGADTTSSLLQDDSQSNPATAAGLIRTYALRLTTRATATAAVQIGRLWMAEASVPQRRGTITLPGMVRHPSEGLVPAWRVRAGDFVQITDRPGDTPREITETSYDHDRRGMSVAVGGLPQKLEAIFERVGVNLLGIQ